MTRVVFELAKLAITFKQKKLQKNEYSDRKFSTKKKICMKSFKLLNKKNQPRNGHKIEKYWIPEEIKKEVKLWRKYVLILSSYGSIHMKNCWSVNKNNIFSQVSQRWIVKSIILKLPKKTRSNEAILFSKLGNENNFDAE